jgi:glycosyltransferase involved in cell wall biosynthesis
MRLLWITNIPSPYRVDFFNELGKSCELTVLFEKAGADDRDSSWLDFVCEHFEGIVMRGLSYSADAAASLEVLKYLRQGAHDAVVVTDFSSPTGALAIAYLKATGRRYFLESDGGFPSGSRFKSWVKRMVIGGAEGYFSTSDVHDEYYLTYGAQPHQLIRYPFTSVREDEVLRVPPTAAQRLAAKKQLGINQPNMILSVGQFIHRKGYDILVKACASINDDTAVCIVGGEPPQEYRKLVSDLALSTVHFAGFKRRAELSVYYTAADVFVLPTREDIWGLVINEALAHALPVITTDRCVAGLELVAKNSCGRIVPVDAPEALAEAIKEVLLNGQQSRSMAEAALSTMNEYTIENMTKRHLEVFENTVRRSLTPKEPNGPAASDPFGGIDV